MLLHLLGDKRLTAFKIQRTQSTEANPDDLSVVRIRTCIRDMHTQTSQSAKVSTFFATFQGQSLWRDLVLQIKEIYFRSKIIKEQLPIHTDGNSTTLRDNSSYVPMVQRENQITNAIFNLKPAFNEQIIANTVTL